MTQSLSLTAPAGHILPFMFDNMPVRGLVLRLQDIETYIPSLQEEGVVGQMLTEMLAASATLVYDLKNKAHVTLQIHSESDLGLMVSQCDKDGGMRAYANLKEKASVADLAYTDVAENKPIFVVNVEQGGHRYQSLIQLNEKSVSSSLEQYFNDSVQLPTYFRVYCDDKNLGNCGAVFLQAMPGDQTKEDDWARLGMLLDTLTKEEAVPGKITDKDLLRRLFAEDVVRVFEQKKLNIVMPNLKERMEKALKSMGVAQVRELLDEGPISMTCEFSGQTITFVEDDVRNIFGTVWNEDTGE